NIGVRGAPPERETMLAHGTVLFFCKRSRWSLVVGVGDAGRRSGWWARSGCSGRWSCRSGSTTRPPLVGDEVEDLHRGLLVREVNSMTERPSESLGGEWVRRGPIQLNATDGSVS